MIRSPHTRRAGIPRVVSTGAEPSRAPAEASPPLLGRLLTAGELARVLRVSRSTVYRWVTEGVLPAVKIGRTVRFRQEDVEHLLRRAEIRPVLHAQDETERGA